MSFVLNQYVIPVRQYRRANTPSGAEYNELLLDAAGKRTEGPGRIVEPLPTETSTINVPGNWDPSSGGIGFTPFTELVYWVEIWDVDLQLVARYQYPESKLTTTELLNLLYGSSSAIHYDGDAPSADLTELLDAERYAP